MEQESLFETPVEAAAQGRLHAWVELLRPRQWIKNLLVAVPLVTSLRLVDLQALGVTAAAFAAFCLLASGIYILNDISDRQSDRLHPRKRQRPIAAGMVTPVTAALIAMVLAAGAFAIAIGLQNVAFAMTLAAYFVINLLYSASLKHVAILEVLLIAAGFFLRVLGGSLAIGAEPSQWLFVVTLFITLLVALLKRRAEFTGLGMAAAGHRPALGEYNLPLLDQLISVTAAGSTMSYALYTISSQHSKLLVLTLPAFLYIEFRYLALVYREGQGDAPEEALLSDRSLQIGVLAFGMTLVGVLYSRL